MSTPCLVEFVDGDRRFMLYIHSDGYPGGDHGFISRLRGFFEIYPRRVTGDLEYLLANFTYYIKRSLEDSAQEVAGWNRSVGEDEDLSWKHPRILFATQGGVGICFDDREYGHQWFYRVFLKERQIQVFNQKKDDLPVEQHSF